MFQRTWWTCTAIAAVSLLLSLVVPGCAELDAPGGLFRGNPNVDDRDGDRIVDALDNCPDAANPDQGNADHDSFGDACDNDSDADGYPDAADNCPSVHNATQSDMDLDGAGDACDNCPGLRNADQANHDTDRFGDLCDGDDDNDGFVDVVDNCRVVGNADQFDLDGDGAGDDCDVDRDGDGVSDAVDNCPDDPNTDQARTGPARIGDVCAFASQTPETWPRVDGASSTEPIARVVASRLMGVPFGWDVDEVRDAGVVRQILPLPRDEVELVTAAWILGNVVHSSAHTATLNLIAGRADLILLPNLPTHEEEQVAKLQGVELELTPVALDAVVLLVQDGNPVQGLSQGQIQQIYTGRLERWDEVGGTAEHIHAMLQPAGTGTTEVFGALIMEEEALAAWPSDHVQKSLPNLVDMVANHRLAIGYASLHDVTWRYQRSFARPLAVNGVAPSAESVAARTYPLTAEVWVVVRAQDAPESPAKRLRDVLVGPVGQSLVARSGYVPMAR